MTEMAGWRRWAIRAAVALLLVAMAVQVGLSTRQQSPSWDEGDHLYSGYMQWTRGETGLNPEHPPLVKLVAALPLLGLHLKIAPREGRYFKTEAYLGGREMLFRNDPKFGGKHTVDELLLRAHLAAMVFGLLLALLVFLAGQEMFGGTAGLIAMTVFVFDPTVLTNAPFVATDMGAACGFFAAIYTFYRFVQRKSWSRAAVCGVAVGLALTAKHSAVLLVPMFGILTIGEMAWRRNKARRLAAGLAAMVAAALVVVWAVYGFRYPMVASGVTLPPIAKQMAQLSPGMQAAVNVCLRWHLLPESYLYGLVDVQRVGETTPTFFMGKVFEHGQRMYFPAILSLKWTLGTLGLLAMALAAYATGKVRRADNFDSPPPQERGVGAPGGRFQGLGCGRELFFLVVPVGVYLGIAIAGPLNIGVRHVLPVFPFCFVLAAGGVAWLAARQRVWAWAVGGLLVWHVANSLAAFPNYMPYANEAWGGAAKTNLYFSDSATDWAQQLKQTRQWTDAHQVKECWFAYFAAPFLLSEDYGIPCKRLPTFDSMWNADVEVPAVLHGPVLVSFGDLNGFEFGSKVRNPYQRLFERGPDDTIAHGVAVFYGDFSLPEVAALEFETREARLRSKHPAEAVAAALQAVALVPRGFDANVALGDALVSAGDKAGAQAAYAVAVERIAEMEPEAQALWQPVLARKMK